jgi:serine/threonine protein kinase
MMEMQIDVKELDYSKTVPTPSLTRSTSGMNPDRGVLRLTRSTNDWDAGHIYGMAIRRQEVLKSGIVLEILKTLDHPNVMRIYDFDEKYVYVEYIDGLVLSNKSQYCISRDGVNVTDYFNANDTFDFAPLDVAVSAMHGMGVALTDIASFNIMVRRDGTSKIIDLLSCMPLTPKFQALDLKRLDEVYAELARNYPGKKITR